MLWQSKHSSTTGTSVPLREPHPDPDTERQLERIRQLHRLMKSAEDLITEFQRNIADTHVRDSSAVKNANVSGGDALKRMSVILTANKERRADAVESIKTQHTLLESLDAQVAEKTAALSKTDLAYL